MNIYLSGNSWHTNAVDSVPMKCIKFSVPFLPVNYFHIFFYESYHDRHAVRSLVQYGGLKLNISNNYNYEGRLY